MDRIPYTAYARSHLTSGMFLVAAVKHSWSRDARTRGREPASGEAAANPKAGEQLGPDRREERQWESNPNAVQCIKSTRTANSNR